MEEDSFRECPVARGLFLCDFALVEDKTRKVSLINLLDRFRASSFPSPPKSFVAYSLLTDGYGDVDLRFTLEDTDEGRELYEFETRIPFRDRLHTVSFLFRVREFSFPRAGVFRALLYANGNLIAQTRIEVVS